MRMVKIARWVALVLASVLLLALAAQAGKAQGPTLQNPGFEGAFTNRGALELEVAQSWDFGYDASYGHRPELKPERVSSGAGRVRNGNYAQKGFTTYAAHKWWLVQTIPATKGLWYHLTAHVWVWSSRYDDPNASIGTGKVWVRAGINPWGDENALSLGTQYGLAHVDEYDKWVEVDVYAQAQSDRISLFLYSQAEYAAKHNDEYWDDVTLAQEVPGAAQPCPTPVPCPTPQPGGGCSDIEAALERVLTRMRLIPTFP